MRSPSSLHSPLGLPRGTMPASLRRAFVGPPPRLGQGKRNRAWSAPGDVDSPLGICYISAIMRTDRLPGRVTRSFALPALALAFLLLFPGPFLFPGAPGVGWSAPGEESQSAKQQAPQKKPAKRQPTPRQTTTEDKEAPITVFARTWDKTKDRVFAQGDVEVHYKDLKLFADEVEVNTETKDVNAVGNVVIQSPDQVISADKAFYNLDSREHKLEKANGMIQPDIFYQADTIEGEGGDGLTLTKARVTSCTH